MKHRLILVVGLVLFALLLTACGGTNVTPTADTAQIARTPAPQAPAQKPAAQPAQPIPQSTDEALAALEINSVEHGLDTLDSYQLTFTMSFEGEENGQKKTGSMTTVEKVVKNPPARHMTVTGLGLSGAAGGSAAETVEMIQIGDKQYMKIGDQCLQSSQADQAPLQNSINPNELFGALRGEKVLGKETINGMPATHYLVNESGAGVMGYVQSKSEAWVADDGQYVVKAVFEATGKDNFFGNSQAEGTIRWTYELSDINASIRIEAPADCGLSEDIPLPPDAADQVSMGDTTIFNTSQSLKDVIAFYEKELEDRGWAKVEENQVSADNMAQLSFSKDESTLRIMITADPGSGTTSVTLMTEKP
jgi:hypothetical protein